MTLRQRSLVFVQCSMMRPVFKLALNCSSLEMTAQPQRGCGSRSKAKAEQVDVAFRGGALLGGDHLAFHDGPLGRRAPGDDPALVLAFALSGLRLVVAGDLHRPIGALAAGILGARDADA